MSVDGPGVVKDGVPKGATGRAFTGELYADFWVR